MRIASVNPALKGGWKIEDPEATKLVLVDSRSAGYQDLQAGMLVLLGEIRKDTEPTNPRRGVQFQQTQPLGRKDLKSVLGWTGELTPQVLAPVIQDWDLKVALLHPGHATLQVFLRLAWALTNIPDEDIVHVFDEPYHVRPQHRLDTSQDPQHLGGSWYAILENGTWVAKAGCYSSQRGFVALPEQPPLAEASEGVHDHLATLNESAANWRRVTEQQRQLLGKTTLWRIIKILSEEDKGIITRLHPHLAPLFSGDPVRAFGVFASLAKGKEWHTTTFR